ncbi:MAG TPA: putative lipid II flippase FtsW [Gaiellaceae bacterium]|nr:putative lipid II flippase FtsW [Gaiellaceae bacterium]
MKRPAGGGLEYHLLVVVTLGLVAFGLVMVYSASSARATLGGDDAAYYLKRQAVYALLGIVALAVLSRTDYRRLRYVVPPLLLTSFALLVAVLVVGIAVNGARRWLTFGPATLQPSELAKLALALWLAAYLSRSPAPQSLGELIRPIGIVFGAAIGLILVEPDLGTAISIVVMLAAVLVVAGTRFSTLAGAGAIGVGLIGAAIWLEPYRRERILSFLDPWQDPQGAGFQSVQAMLALGSGGFFGVGLGESVQKVYYLPEASTDMIFAIIGEELGLFGAFAVLGAFVVFGYAGFNVALACKDPFGKLLAAGITALICGQAAVNVSAVMGLAPLTGIPLPLVSYGGSSLVVLLASVGILLNIAVNHAAAESSAKVPDRRRRDGRTRPARARSRRGAAEPRRVRHARRSA